MDRLDFFIQPEVEPGLSRAADLHFMKAARRHGSDFGVLRLYRFPTDRLLIGRYQSAPALGSETLPWCRRLTGGRAYPAGTGFVGLSLVLPHRSALFGDDPLALSAVQVLNRYVRGILAAGRRLGLSLLYPGRDLITAGRKTVGAISCETDENGALLFDAWLAVERSWAVVTNFLEAADPAGAVRAELVAPGQTTCLNDLLGRPLTFEELCAAVTAGFRDQFRIAIAPRDMTVLERRAIETRAARTEGGEDPYGPSRRSAPLDRRASTWGQLGAFEIQFSLHKDAFLKDVRLLGDFIANSPAIEEVERGLRLCPLEWRSIDAVVNRVFARPENFLLGIGKLRTIADLLLREIAR